VPRDSSHSRNALSSSCPVVFLSTVHRPDNRKKRRAGPARDGDARKFLVALVSHRPGEGGERRRGNKKGTNPGPPDRTRRTRRTAIVLRTPPRVLSSTAANCGPPFGTKRPQVQILSPRPSPQVSDLRKCRASVAWVPLQPPSRRPEGTKKEHEGTPGKAGADFVRQKNTRPPARPLQTHGTAGTLRAKSDPPSATKWPFGRTARPPGSSADPKNSSGSGPSTSAPSAEDPVDPSAFSDGMIGRCFCQLQGLESSS